MLNLSDNKEVAERISRVCPANIYRCAERSSNPRGLTRQFGCVGPATVQCWAGVVDGGPALERGWIDASSHPGILIDVRFLYMYYIVKCTFALLKIVVIYVKTWARIPGGGLSISATRYWSPKVYELIGAQRFATIVSVKYRCHFSLHIQNLAETDTHYVWLYNIRPTTMNMCVYQEICLMLRI